jgi:hypothetical protein
MPPLFERRHGRRTPQDDDVIFAGVEPQLERLGLQRRTFPAASHRIHALHGGSASGGL